MIGASTDCISCSSKRVQTCKGVIRSTRTIRTCKNVAVPSSAVGSHFSEVQLHATKIAIQLTGLGSHTEKFRLTEGCRVSRISSARQAHKKCRNPTICSEIRTSASAHLEARLLESVALELRALHLAARCQRRTQCQEVRRCRAPDALRHPE